jgi:hypothetical protein
MPAGTATPVDWDVQAWRFDQLVRAGWPVELAVDLAKLVDVDLHEACDLLVHGAEPSTALRILT